MAKREKTDPNREIALANMPEIRRRMATGEKATAVAHWLRTAAGFEGDGGTLNGYLKMLPADPPPAAAPAVTGIKIGYARVSTDDQTLDMQLDALRAAGCERIYQEHAGGKDVPRPELVHALQALRAGDTLTVWRLDRLGRSLPHLVEMITQIQAQGAAFESLTEKIETGTATGRLTFHVFAALAEFERDLIRERTKEGLKAARARGRNGGRPPKLTPREVAEVKGLMADRTISAASVAKRYGVSRSTLYAVCRPAPPK
jgi:DNA invertase Pin-like site-specific DNA recombinase